MAPWVWPQQAWRLKMVFVVSYTWPRASTILSGSGCWLVALRYPLEASNIDAGPVNPLWARRAAVTPSLAARPALKGLAIVPKLSMSPDAWVPAIPSAWRMVSSSSPKSFPAATAAPKVPQVPVGCQ